jgi:hypothetical protein
MSCIDFHIDTHFAVRVLSLLRIIEFYTLLGKVILSVTIFYYSIYLSRYTGCLLKFLSEF